VTILADSFEEEIGGLAYDKTLADYFADEIDRKEGNSVSVKEDSKVMIKLMYESNKVKEVLSANKEASIHILGLYNNKDFSSHITRAKFEEISGFLTAKLANVLKNVIGKANLTLQQINSAELIGGGVRIPIIQSFLQSALPNIELGQHLNGDESVALGAAFMAANNS